MTEEKRETNWTAPWFLRRVMYAVVGLAMLLLAGLGLIEEGQIDTIAASPILGTVVAWLAAAKTNPGSDSTVTAADVEVSRKARAELDAQLAALQSQIQDQVQGAVSGAVDLLPDRVQEAVRSIYDAPYGRHEQVAAPEPDGSGPSRYPEA